MKKENALAIRVAYETGLRIDDVLTLPLTALEGQTLKYTAKKTGKSGEKHITKRTAEKLAANGARGLMFPSPKTMGCRTRQAVYQDMKDVCKRLKIVGQISPHSARKAYAVELRKRSGLEAAKAELQHSRTDTTMIYAFSDVFGAEPTADEAAKLDYLAEVIADRIIMRLKKLP